MNKSQLAIIAGISLLVFANSGYFIRRGKAKSKIEGV